MIQRSVHDTLPVGMIHLKREIEGTLADGGIFECDDQINRANEIPEK